MLVCKGDGCLIRLPYYLILVAVPAIGLPLRWDPQSGRALAFILSSRGVGELKTVNISSRNFTTLTDCQYYGSISTESLFSTVVSGKWFVFSFHDVFRHSIHWRLMDFNC